MAAAVSGTRLAVAGLGKMGEPIADAPASSSGCDLSAVRLYTASG